MVGRLALVIAGGLVGAALVAEVDHRQAAERMALDVAACEPGEQALVNPAAPIGSPTRVLCLVLHTGYLFGPNAGKAHGEGIIIGVEPQRGVEEQR